MNQKLTNNRVDLLSTKVVDLHGRQIKNAADSTDPGDYITKRELLAQINSLNATIAANKLATKQIFQYSLHFNGGFSLSAADIANHEYIATNSNVIYLRADLVNPPVNSTLNLTLYQINVALGSAITVGTFSIPSGINSTIITTTDLAKFAQLKANYYFRLDNSGSGNNYGSILTVTIRAK